MWLIRKSAKWVLICFVFILTEAALPAHSELTTDQRGPIALSCVNALSTNFKNPPDDRYLGLVTARVPFVAANILLAYRQGIFPWREGEWYNPPERGVLFLDDVHVGQSDRKILRRMLWSGEYEVTDDVDFEGVIRGCARMERFTRDSSGAKVPAAEWLTQKFIDEYTKLFHLGVAHSVEVWHHGELVGGLYGVFVEGVFTGESMFRKPDSPNVTKLALLHLIDRLKENGHDFIDTQMSVGLIQKWGGRKIRRSEYLALLQKAQRFHRPY